MALFDDPRFLSQFGTSVNVGGQFLGALSHVKAGRAARQAAEFEAEQLRQNAGQAQAAGQYAAEDVAMRTKLLTSRALAVAAAGGGGASDPGVVSAIAGIAGEGAYRQALALYGGDERARDLRSAADSAEYRGRLTESNERRAAIGRTVSAGASAVRGSAQTRSLLRDYESQSLRSKYGGAGPSQINADGNMRNDYAWDWGADS
jgi:hypothetical protein